MMFFLYNFLAKLQNSPRQPSNPSLQLFHSLHEGIKFWRLAINEESSHIGIVGYPSFALRFWYEEIDGRWVMQVVVYIL